MSSKLHSSWRFMQFPQGTHSSHFTRRCLQRWHPVRTFFDPSCGILMLCTERHTYATLSCELPAPKLALSVL